MDSLEFIRRPVALTGIGGSGKSHAMLDTIRRIRHHGTRQQPVITFFSASTPFQLDSDLKTWFQQIGAQWPYNDERPVSDAGKINAALKVIGDITKKTQWLVFLDNVHNCTKELETFVKHLLRNDAFVVLATSNSDISFTFKVERIRIEPLSRDDCMQYLEAKMKFKFDPSEVQKLCSLLPKIPRILKPTLAYILHHNFESIFHGLDESAIVCLTKRFLN